VTPALQPYPAYKPSGVPWLGDVPEHWDVRKLRHLLKRVTERNQPSLPLLSVVREKGVILRDTTSKEENHNFIPDDLSNYKVVRTGQFAMNKMKAWQGSYGISKFDGIVSPAYFVFDMNGVEASFFHTAIRSRAYVPCFTQASDGVRIGQWDLAEARMKEISFSVPSLPEQAAIVWYLDYMDRRIRRYIRAKQKLVKLLEEQKQAVIHQAVTRGLDPNVPLKPSGVEWLGDVPAHWEVVPNRAMLRLRKTIVGINSDDYVLLSLTKRGVIPRDMENPEGKFPAVFDTYQEIETGDLIFCLFDIDETPRAVGLSPMPGMVTGAYTRFECKCPSALEFVYLFYLAMDNGKRLKPLYSGLRKVITKSTFLSAKMPLPPKEEQESIVAHIRNMTLRVDTARERAESEIALLREYRTRLIADVVTGKLDVREAAANLPDEAEEPEPLEEIEETEVEETEAEDDGEEGE